MIYRFIIASIFLGGLIFFNSCKNEPDKKVEKKETSTAIKSAVEDNHNDEYIQDYIKKGVAIAKASGKTLKGKLTAAVEKGGLQNGINTCNKIAQNLMDSLSNAYETKIKRTSLKLRNPKDKPDQDEMDILIAFEKEVKAGNKLKPTAKKLENGDIRVYIPIFVDKVCLNCHGKIGQELKPANYSLIKKHYPNDEAINYSEGDLRGMWSITFDEK